MKNATVAECFEGENTNGTIRECYISECPNAQLAKSYALVSQTHCYVVGALLVLVAAVIMFVQVLNPDREKEWGTAERESQRIRASYRDFNASNISFFMRASFILGIEVIVLGGISGNYYLTLSFLGAYQCFEFITVVWKTNKIIVPDRIEKIKDTTRRVKRKVKRRESITDAGKKIIEAWKKIIEHFIAPEDEDEVSPAYEVSPDDIYDDITTPIARVSLLFLCQIILLILYLTAIYTSGSADFTEKEPYIYFITGVFVQISYQEAKDKQPMACFNRKKKYWTKIMKARKTKTKKGKTKTFVECVDKEGQPHYVPQSSLVARIIMSNLVNCQGTSMLLYLLPLHLSHSEDAIDFVLNSCAAYIIVELDDAIDTETIKLIHGSTDVTDVTECNTPCSETHGSAIFANSDREASKTSDCQDPHGV